MFTEPAGLAAGIRLAAASPIVRGFAIGRAGIGVLMRVQPANAAGHEDDRPESLPAYMAFEAPNDFTVS